MGDFMKMLVTGGAGFIGSNFVRQMLQKYENAEIVNLDLLTYAGRLENIKDLDKDSRHIFVRGDIRNRETVERIVKNEIDNIVNFAAETHVDRSIAEAGAFIETDVYGTYTLLDAGRRCDVDRVIQVSTDEVYGSIQEGTFKETDSLNPSSPYAASKASADLLALSFYKTYGMNVSVTRSSNNFGPYQYPEKLIPKLVLRALHDEPLPLYGDGTHQRDWVYVLDNCAGIDLVVREGKAGEIYNIASGTERTNLEVAKFVLKTLNKPDSLVKFVSDRPGHDRRYSLDTTKVRKLGWKPLHAFENALKRTVEWYTHNKWWWLPLLKDKSVRSDTPWL